MVDSVSKALGARIKALRNQAGMSQDALGDAARMDRRFVSRLEVGSANVTLASLARIAFALGCTLGEMFEGVVVDEATVRALERASRPRGAPAKADD